LPVCLSLKGPYHAWLAQDPSPSKIPRGSHHLLPITARAMGAAGCEDEELDFRLIFGEEEREAFPQET
ncbi:hypothetical protein NDU88_003973, partial [Pleurodeles waltl]